jgi:hypothetical protein
MESNKNEIRISRVTLDSLNLRKAEEIFNKQLSKNKSNWLKEEKNKPKNLKFSQQKYLKVLKNLVKKNFQSYYSKVYSKRILVQCLKNFYRDYNLAFYTQLFSLRLKFQKSLRITSLQKQTTYFYSVYIRVIYLKALKLKLISENLSHKLKRLLSDIKTKKTFFKSKLILKNNLDLLKFSKYLLSNEIKFSIFINKFNEKLINFKELVERNSLLIFVLKTFNDLLKKLKKIVLNVYSTRLVSFLSNNKQVSVYLKRLRLVISIYILPVIFLSTQALVPLNEEYQYLIVNPFSSRLLNKIPFLVQVIQFFQPLTTNSTLLIWILLGYYFTFTSGYRSLKIPYKIAYNGTIASIFLIINYSCILVQFLMRFIFESFKIINDIFFTSYLIKHLSKNKNKERDEAVKIFANLVTRYDSELIRNYYQFLLFINHRIVSHLALISLAALLYNCIYYIIYNKNPEIILVTKAALASIKNPQESEE